MANLCKFLLFVFIVIFQPASAVANGTTPNDNFHKDPINGSISGSTTVCQNAAAPQVTFTGSGGSAPYTFTYHINTGGDLTITTSSGDSVSITVPTTTIGTFTYTLTGVSSGGNPTQVIAGEAATITVVAPFTVNAGSDMVICKGSSINLGATLSSGAPNGANFNWSGPNNYSSNTQTIIRTNATSSMGGAYTVTASAGQCQASDVVNVTVLEPQISSSNLQEYEGTQWLVKCTNPGAASGSIFVANGLPSSLQNLVTNYTINWGDNSSFFTSTSGDWNSGGNVSHTYNVGLYNLVITINTTLNCTITRTYKVFVGNQPASPQIQLPENAQGCVPFSLIFPISGVTNNIPGTTYTITFSDDPTHPLSYDQTNIPTSVTRTFTNSSCNSTFVNGNNTENNAFGVSIRAVNPCGSASSSAGPIRTSTPPTALVDLPATGCVNQTISMLNQTVNGSIVTSNSCNTSSGRYWEITPSTGWTIVSGNIGSNGGFPDEYEGWNNGSQNLNIKFTSVGNYTVKLYVRNGCSTTSTISKTICIESAPTASFTLNTNSGCAPLTVQATNATNVTNNCNTTYNWSVAYAAGNCGTSSGSGFFASGSSATSVSPTFNFQNAGTYTITLTVNTSCGPVTSTKTVTVKQKPTVALNAPASLCGGSSITPTANVDACGSATAATYLWTFQGGSPATSTNLNPGSVTYAAAGTYDIKLEVTNECGTTTKIQQITVSAPVVANAGGDITICGGANAVLAGSASGGSGSGYTYTWSPATGLSATNIANPTATPTATTTYTLTVKNTSTNCTATDEVVVSVNAINAGVLSLSQTICSGSDPALITETTAATGGGTVSYQWEQSVAGPASGFADIAGATSATYDPPGPVTQQTWYRRRVISTLNGVTCEKITNASEVVINGITPGTIAGNQTICTGGDPSALTVSIAATGSGPVSYQWQSSTDNSNFTNIPGATNATYDPGSLTQTTYYRRTAKSVFNSTTCTADSNVITITVKPDPVVDVQPLAEQTLCQGANAAALTVTVSGGEGNASYQWYSGTTPSNTGGTAITAANGGTQATFTPPSNTVGVTYYYCVITQTGAGCSATSAVAKVTVTQAPQVSTQPIGSIVCQGGTPAQLTVAYSNGTGTPVYQWYSNTSNSNTGGTAIGSATAATYQPQATTVGTTWYYAEITFSGGSCNAIKSVPVAVEVKAMPTFTAQPTVSQTICVGGIVAALSVATSNGAGTVSYQWYSNSSNSSSGGSAISGATGASYTPPAFNTAGNYYYYAVVTHSGNGCGSITSDVAAVTVVADPTINSQPLATQTLCKDAIPQDLTVAAAGGTGTLQYQWYSNTSNSTTGGTAITSNGTSANYTSPTNTVGTFYYYVVVTTPASGCSVTSAVSQVTVNPAPTFTTQPQGTTVCVDGTLAPLSVSYANGTGTASYQWYESTTGSGSGGTAITNATGATFSPPTNLPGTRYYYAIINFSSGGCTSITSQVATITVNPDPTIDAQPTAQQEICVGGTLSPLSVSFAGGVGTASYQWYSNATASNAGGTALSGATGSSYTPTTNTTPGTYYFYAVVTLSGSGCGSVASAPAAITVVPDPTITSAAFTSQTLCESAPATPLTVTATGGSGTGYTYQWFVNSTNSNSGGTPVTGETASTFTPPTTPTGTKYYYCEVTTPASGCLVKSTVAEVKVMPSPTFTTQPQSSTVCHGQTPPQLSVAYTNGTGAASYQWFENATNAPSGGTAVPGATGATFQPSGAAVGTRYYYNQITFSSGGCQVITSNVAVVTVDAVPSVTTAQTAAICSGQAFTITPADGGGNSVPAGTTYTWTAPAGSNITGGSAQATGVASISQTLTNTTNVPVTATYTVTPKLGNCSGTPFSVTVTVNPTPVIANATKTVCSGEAFDINPATITGNNVPAGTTYTWSAPTMPAGINGATLGTDLTTIGGTLTNSTNAPLTVTYTIVPKWPTGGCTGTSFTLAVTVNPVPAIPAINAPSICSNAAFSVSPANGTDGIVPAGTTYTWSAPVISPAGAITGGSAQPSQQAQISQTLVNTTNAIATATYTVTPKSGSCTGNTFTVTVPVNPVPTANTLTNQTLCNGNMTTAVPFSGAVTGTTYNWSNDTPAIGLAASGSGDIGAFTATNNGTAPVTATITVTPQYGGCNGQPKTFTITVNPAPSVTFSQPDQAICSGTSSTAVTLTSATPATSFNWTATVPPGVTGVATSGTNTIPVQNLVNTTPNPVIVEYVAIAQTTGVACPGAPVTYRITVTPVPFVSTTQQQTVCSGTAFNVLPADGAPNNVPPGTTFTWTMPSGSGFTGASAQATPVNTISQTLINTTASPVTAVYTVIPRFNSCAGVPFTVTVTVNPTAVIADTATTICTGGSFAIDPTLISGASIPAGTTYSWGAPAVTGGLTGGAGGSAQNTITGSLANPTAATQTATYTVTPLSPIGTCAGDPFDIVVTVRPQLVVTPQLSNFNGFEISTAGGNDGWINLSPTGGSGSYTYSWTGPNGFTSSAQNITGLTAGTYTATISDGLCSNVVLTLQVREPLPLVIQEVATGHINVNCYGQSTGAIAVEITQVSIAPFDYILNLQGGGTVQTITDTNALTYTFNNLPAGTYDVQVRDANGTIKTIAGIIITQPASGLAISNAAVSSHNGFSITCNGANDGSIDLTVSGGYPAYTYAWTGPAGFTASSEDIAGLAPGIYTVIIGDTTGVCTITQSYTITEPQQLTYTGSISNFNGYSISCNGGNNGAITITAAGGTGTYAYQWSGPNGFTATLQNLSGLYAGTYTLTVTDSNGCINSSGVYTLTEPAAMDVTETHTDLLCFGASTGSINVNVTGGVPAYTYAWTGPSGFVSNSQNLSNIPAGAYTLVVTDASGCSKNITVTLTQPTEITIIPTTTPITCYGANNASISLAISGGVGTYSVAWDNLATGTYQNNLAAGNYIITVTDSNACNKIITVNIPEAPIFTIYPVKTDISCHGANDGSIVLNLVGGQAPVSLVWADGSTAGTARYNLPAGTYSVTITDGTPCYITRSFTILEPNPLAVSGQITHALDCTNTSGGAVNLIVAGGTPPFTYSWSNGATTEDIANLTSGTYAVAVTDSRGCTVNKQFTITRPQPLTLDVSSNVTFNCNTNYVNQVNTAQAAGGMPPYVYSWSSGTVSGSHGQNMTTNQNGTIIATVTDVLGCTATVSFEVDTQQLGNPSFTATSYGQTTYSLYSIYDPILFTNTSTGDFTEVAWDFGDGSVSNETSPEHTYLREGTYIVKQTVVYPYGCTKEVTYTIVIEKGYDVMLPNGFTPNGDGINEEFNVQHRGLKSLKLDVYDTWGSLIYHEEGETLQGWNGTIGGVPAENGNYYYKVEVEIFYGHKAKYEGPMVLIK